MHPKNSNIGKQKKTMLLIAFFLLIRILWSSRKVCEINDLLSFITLSDIILRVKINVKEKVN